MKRLMLGNEAVARGVYEACGRVASSYPGTPSTEITEFIAGYDEIYSEWAPNEKVALEVAIGASVGGARAFCAMKHVGLNVAADPLFTVSYTGVNGGLLIAVADDPGMHSSQNEQDSRNYAKAAKILMLEPSDSQECLDYTKKAYELSEQFDTPVLLRLSTRVSHSQSIVTDGERTDVALAEYTKNPQKYVMMPAMARGRRVCVENRQNELIKFAETTNLNKLELNDKSIGIITSGIAYQYAKEAMPTASFLKLGMIYPMPIDLIKQFAAKVDKLYVIEELDGFIETHCAEIGVSVTGKALFPNIGELNANLIRKILQNATYKSLNYSEQIPVRPPVMCPACPHRPVFYTLNKLKLIVFGDIGCYTLGALPPLEAMDLCVCMGAGIGALHGLEKARGSGFAQKSVAVIGDSTFIHSGVTSLINLVYNNSTSTVIILDNSITGMTGHQDNPATGYNIKGQPSPKLDLVALAHAIGVKRVKVCNPFELNEFEEVLKEEMASQELSVIIAQSPCALLKTRKPSAPFRCDLETCTGCGMCMRLGCPAITMSDKKMQINQTLCLGCSLCSTVCKFNAVLKAEV